MFSNYAKFLAIPALVLIAACSSGSSDSASTDTGNEAALAQLDELLAQAATTDANLQTFDNLDFDVFTNQKWDLLHESHAEDIIVHWPDGHQTEGIEVHIDDLKAMFVWAPDTRIEVHPIKFGAGNYTAVTGVMEGTFTEPMPIGDGQFIEPTGMAYKIDMATIGLWGEDGTMTEEWLFWDNLTFYQQIGLAE